jgi:hypothetical protein
MQKLSAKCWILAFNAQGSRGIILVVQVRAMKNYVAVVEALRKKERQGETQGTGIVFPWLYGYLYCLTDSNESHVREVSVHWFNSTLKSLHNILIWTVWLEKATECMEYVPDPRPQ